MRRTDDGDGDGTDLSPSVSLSSRDELLAVSTTPPPIHTIVGSIIPNGIIPILAGETVVATETGEIHATGPGTGGFSGDVDGPLLSGHLSCSNLTLDNSNTGANAYHYGMTSATRVLRLHECTSIGDAKGILVSGVTAGRVDGYVQAEGLGDRGVVFDGQVGAFVLSGPSLLGAAAVTGWRGVETLATFELLAGLSIYSTSIAIQDPTHRGFRLADAAVFGPGVLVAIMGSAHSGDQALMFDQSAGAMPLSDLRLIVEGSTSGNWSACIAAKRTDLANPLIVAYPAFPAAAPTPIPYSDGVNPAEVDVVGVPARWELVKDDPSPGDHYFVFKGPKVAALHRVEVDILVDRNAGTQPIKLCLQKALSATPTTWAAVPSTVRGADNTNAFLQQVIAGGQETFSVGDRIRGASQNLADSVPARIYDITYTIASSGG